jgi:hypothetical protein
MPIADVEHVMMASAVVLPAQHFPRKVTDWDGRPAIEIITATGTAPPNKYRSTMMAAAPTPLPSVVTITIAAAAATADAAAAAATTTTAAKPSPSHCQAAAIDIDVDIAVAATMMV